MVKYNEYNAYFLDNDNNINIRVGVILYTVCTDSIIPLLFVAAWSDTIHIYLLCIGNTLLSYPSRFDWFESQECCSDNSNENTYVNSHRDKNCDSLGNSG